MGTDLMTLFQRFELLTFFAGYPFLYIMVSLLAVGRWGVFGIGTQKSLMLLPTSYAMVGTLFLLFLVWQANRSASFPITLLRMWGVLAMIFWLPALRNRRILPFLHSLVFFGLVALDIIVGLSTPAGRDQIHNDMTICSISFLLHATAFVLLLLAVFVRRTIRRHPPV
jgi:hypothetical protein